MDGLAPTDRGSQLTAAQVLARLNANATIALTAPVTMASTLGVTGTITGSSTVQGTQLISTVATGTAPFVVTSTTVVPNLNVATLSGGTWASPAAIGSTTPNSGAFTTLSASGAATFIGGSATVKTTGASEVSFDIDDGSSGGGQSRLLLFTNSGAGTKTNWRIGAQITLNHTLEIGHSTAVGGSTYTTDFTIDNSGNVAVTGGSLAVNGDGNARRIGFNFFGSDTWGFYTDGSSDAAKMHLRYGTTSYGNIDASGNLTLSGGTNGIGYSTGAGGTVTQATSKSTGVTLNKVCGTITLNNASLAANTSVAFTWTNSAIAATDYVDIQHDSVGTLGAYSVCITPGAGSATVTVRNNTAGALAEAIVLRFFVTKAVTA